MSAGCSVSRVTQPPAHARKSLRRLLLSSLGRARSHGLGLKRAVAHVEIALEPVVALGCEQLSADRVVGRVRERAEGTFEEEPRITPGGRMPIMVTALLSRTDGSGTRQMRFASARAASMS